MGRSAMLCLKAGGGWRGRALVFTGALRRAGGSALRFLGLQLGLCCLPSTG